MPKQNLAKRREWKRKLAAWTESGLSGPNPHFSPALGKFEHLPFRSFQELLLERFKNLPFEKFLASRKTEVANFPAELVRNTG